MTGGNVVPVRQVAPIAFTETLRLAEAIAKSGLFGMKTIDQALALMAIAQAEGRHPALAARDYSIIQGRPTKNSEAMMRDFLESGGRVEWHQLDDSGCAATFSHPAGGTVKIEWDMDRATRAGLGNKANWKQYPRQMLRSRVVSEGVRTVCPMATSGMYVPEEVADFDREPKDITSSRPMPAEPAGNGKDATSTEPSHIRSAIGSAAVSAPHDPATGEVLPPHAIPAIVGADFNPVIWGGQFIAAVRTATNQAEINEWIEQNGGILDDIRDNFPRAWRSIDNAMTAHRAKLGPDEPDLLGPNDTESVLAAK